MNNSKQGSMWQKIKKRRLKLKLTQEELARKSDICYSTYSKIESRVIKNPTVKTVKKIADALDITIDALIS